MRTNTPQLDLPLPRRTLTTLTCEATRADAVVARVRALNGVLLSFAPRPAGLIDLHIIIADDLVEQVATEGRP